MAPSSGGLRPGRFFLCHPTPSKRTAEVMRGRTAEDLKLLELLDPVAEAAGYEIVRLRLMGGAERRRLQIMAEDKNGEMVVSDCAILSRKLSEVLDAADPISGEYTLEV